jgi:CheY-like chemotaxis protein
MSSEPAKMNILVVEDEDLLRWTVRRKLEDAGFMVLDAPSCVAAMNAAGTTRIDLLISDYRLEDGFGDELARKIGSASKNMGLILMTGEAEHLDADSIDGVQLLRIFSKPVDLGALASLAADWSPAETHRGEVDSRVGGFRICRIASADDIVEFDECKPDDLALEIFGDVGRGAEEELCALLKRLSVSGRRICVVGRLTAAAAEVCREAGVEVVADRSDLAVLSRRLVSRSERSAVLSVSVLRNS